MAIIITSRVREKLLYKIPPVRFYEIEECFWNRTTRILIENRGKHRTNPPSRWFITETIAGRRLKVVFILSKNGDQIVKTAYVPNLAEERIYEQKTAGG
jgi:hypothetical protein